jgi:hypothetical protein
MRMRLQRILNGYTDPNYLYNMADTADSSPRAESRVACEVYLASRMRGDA